MGDKKHDLVALEEDMPVDMVVGKLAVDKVACHSYPCWRYEQAVHSLDRCDHRKDCAVTRFITFSLHVRYCRF